MFTYYVMLPPIEETRMFWGQYQQRTLPWLICMLSHKSSGVSCCWQQGRTSAAESILVAAWVTGARRRGWQELGMEKLWVAASHTQEKTLAQWRSPEHGSGGWWLRSSVAGGCAEEAGKQHCDCVDQLARHTYSPAPRAGKSACS